MGLSKAKKAIIKLKQRVETVEMNKDMIERAVGKESAEETLKCVDEIKTFLEAYEKQVELNKILNKKVVNQRFKICGLENKRSEKKKENYVYYVVYTGFYLTGGFGIGKCKVERNSKLDLIEDIIGLAEGIAADKCFKEVVILNFQELEA